MSLNLVVEIVHVFVGAADVVLLHTHTGTRRQCALVPKPTPTCAQLTQPSCEHGQSHVTRQTEHTRPGQTPRTRIRPHVTSSTSAHVPWSNLALWSNTQLTCSAMATSLIRSRTARISPSSPRHAAIRSERLRKHKESALGSMRALSLRPPSSRSARSPYKSTSASTILTTQSARTTRSSAAPTLWSRERCCACWVRIGALVGC
eukprot:811359-Rhodomonas_salina.2